MYSHSGQVLNQCFMSHLLCEIWKQHIIFLLESFYSRFSLIAFYWCPVLVYKLCVDTAEQLRKAFFLLSLKIEEDPENISSAAAAPNVLQDISTEPSRFSTVSGSFTTPPSTEPTPPMISEEPGATDVLLHHFHLSVVLTNASTIIITQLILYFLFTHSLCSVIALTVSISGPVEATLPQNTVELTASVNHNDTAGMSFCIWINVHSWIIIMHIKWSWWCIFPRKLLTRLSGLW